MSSSTEKTQGRSYSELLARHNTQLSGKELVFKNTETPIYRVYMNILFWTVDTVTGVLSMTLIDF